MEADESALRNAAAELADERRKAAAASYWAVFARGLPFWASREMLCAAFRAYGAVKSVALKAMHKVRWPNLNAGCGVVVFASRSGLEAIMRAAAVGGVRLHFEGRRDPWSLRTAAVTEDSELPRRSLVACSARSTAVSIGVWTDPSAVGVCWPPRGSAAVSAVMSVDPEARTLAVTLKRVPESLLDTLLSEAPLRAPSGDIGALLRGLVLGDHAADSTAAVIRLVVDLTSLTGWCRLCSGGSNNNYVLALRLKHPPFVFVCRSLLGDNDGDDADVVWDRACDFTINSVLGNANALALAFDESPQQRGEWNGVLSTLAQLHLRPGGGAACRPEGACALCAFTPLVYEWSRSDVDLLGFRGLYALDELRGLHFGAPSDPAQPLLAEARVLLGGGDHDGVTIEARRACLVDALCELPSIASKLGQGAGELVAALRESFQEGVAAHADADAIGFLGAAPRASPAPVSLPIHRVFVTPTRVLCREPEIESACLAIHVVAEQARLPLHEAADHFLRVIFVDEHLGKELYEVMTQTGGTGEALYARMARHMRAGLTIAGRHFEFLGWSNAMLKSHALFMFSTPSSAPALSASQLLGLLGDFSSIAVVAKAAARIGQCFSSTVRSSAPLASRLFCKIDEVERNGYTFSDGVGRVSLQMARELFRGYVAAMRSRRRAVLSDDDATLLPPLLPSAFQIRFGGAKGVVSLDSTLSGRVLQLRGSMLKFESTHTTVEVCTTARYSAAFLNRQILPLLSCRGVPPAGILQLLDEMLETLLRCSSSDVDARGVLLSGCCGNMPGIACDELADVIAAGFSVATEPFIASLLAAVRDARLSELKDRARVHVPRAANLIGVMDEAGLLREDECFFACGVISPRLLATTRCRHLGCAITPARSLSQSARVCTPAICAP